MSVNINVGEIDQDSPLVNSEMDVMISLEEFQMFKGTYVASIEKTSDELNELRNEQEKLEAEKSQMQKKMFEMENSLNKLSISTVSAQEKLKHINVEREMDALVSNGVQEQRVKGLLERLREIKKK